MKRTVQGNHILSYCFWVGQAFRLGNLNPRHRMGFSPWGMLSSQPEREHTPGPEGPFVARPKIAKPKGLAYLEAKTSQQN